MAFPIPVFTAHDSGLYANLQGLRWPAGIGDPVRVPQTRCAGCSRSNNAASPLGTHYNIRLLNQTGLATRTAQEALIGYSNGLGLEFMKLQRLASLMDVAAHGIFSSNEYEIDGLYPSVMVGGWTLTGASETAISCSQGGGPDPRAITNIGALYGDGLVVLANSNLSYHAGWIFQGITFTSLESFSLRIDTPGGGIAATPADGVGPVLVYVWLYNPLARPLWFRHRPRYPLWSTADPLSGAQYALGQDRCANSREDWTGSWGTADGAGLKWHCGKRAELIAGDFEEFLTAYIPACQQTECPYYAADAATNPLDMIQGMLYGARWREEQINIGAPDLALTNIGPVSLAHLCGEDYSYAGGPYISRAHNLMSEGYGTILTKNDAVTLKPLAVFVSGFETCLTNSVSDAEDYSDGSTWAPAGPGGEVKVTPTINIANLGADDSNDPLHKCRNSAVNGGVSQNRYTQYVDDHIGECVRWRQTSIHFGHIQDLSGEQAYEHGTVEIGAWNADLSPYVGGGTAPVKTIVRVKRGVSMDKTGAFPAARLVNNAVRIGTLTDGGGGKAQLDIKHASDSFSRTVSGEESAISVNWGGVQMLIKERSRPTNRRSASCVVGNAASWSIEPGHCLCLDDASLPAHIQLVRFGITRAEPCSGAGTDWWNPAPGEGYDQAADDAWYTSNVSGLGGLPAGFATWGNKMALLEVEGGLETLAWLDANGYPLSGLTLSVRDGWMMRTEDLSYALGEPGTGDAAISAVTAYPAAGVFGFAESAVGKCLTINGWLRDSNSLISTPNVLNSVRAAYRKALQGVRTRWGATGQGADSRTFALEVFFDAPEGAPYPNWDTDHPNGDRWQEGEGEGSVKYFYDTGADGTGTRCIAGIVMGGPPPKSDWYSAEFVYYNPVLPLRNGELDAAFYTSAALSEAWINVTLANLVLTRTKWEMELSATNKNGVDGWICDGNDVGDGRYYNTRQTIDEDMDDALSLKLCLMGINWVGGVAKYTTLATTGGSAATVATGDAVKFDVKDFAGAYLTNRNNHTSFGFAVLVDGYTPETFETTEGSKAFQDLFWGIYKRAVTKETVSAVDYLIGTIEAASIAYDRFGLGDTYLKLDPDEVSLDANSRPFYGGVPDQD